MNEPKTNNWNDLPESEQEALQNYVDASENIFSIQGNDYYYGSQHGVLANGSPGINAEYQEPVANRLLVGNTVFHILGSNATGNVGSIQIEMLGSNVDQSPITDIGFIGIEVLGSRTTVAIEEFASGGAGLGGLTELSIFIQEFTFSGIETGGEANDEYIEYTEDFNEIASGGIEVNGESNFNTTVEQITSGGIELSGASKPNNLITKITTGGIELGGISSEETITEIFISGGVGLSGESGLSTIIIQVASGGIELNGESKPSTIVIPVALGGVELAGVAIEEYIEYTENFNEVASGGAQVNGESKLSTINEKTSLIKVNGGLNIEGTIKNTISVKAPLIYGGIQLNGEAYVTAWIFSQLHIINYKGEDGVYLSGNSGKDEISKQSVTSEDLSICIQGREHQYEEERKKYDLQRGNHIRQKMLQDKLKAEQENENEDIFISILEHEDNEKEKASYDKERGDHIRQKMIQDKLNGNT